MSHESEFNYFEKMAHWSFDEFGIHSESLTDWHLYALLESFATPDSRILDLGTGGGEKVLSFFPDCAEILGTDYSPQMVETARRSLAKSGRKNISFRVMDNLNMDVPDEHFDIVVARHTITDAGQVFRSLKPGGHFCGCFYIKDECGRTDWFIRHLYQPKGFFTAPYETQSSLRERLSRMYQNAEVSAVEGIGCFRCGK